MIPTCGRKLEYDIQEMDVDARQLQLFGEKSNFELQRSLTSVRYKAVQEAIDIDNISNIFENGFQQAAIDQLCEIIKALQKRVAELEEKK